MRILTYILFLIISFHPAYPQETGNEILRVIDSSDIILLKDVLENDRIDQRIGPDSLTALTYAVTKRDKKIVRLLIKKGADVNVFSGELTPLMWASRLKDPELVRILLESGSNPDQVNPKGITALMFAGLSGCMECAKMLVEWGANPGAMNIYGKDPYYYARTAGNYLMADYLRLKALEFKGFSEDTFDGPHIEWIGDERVRMKYFLYKSGSQKAGRIIKKRKVPEPGSVLQGLKSDAGRFFTENEITPERSEFQSVDSVFVFGDIHGNYSKFVTVMKNSGIINEDMNWEWGKGHLVLIGDVFDKGNHVTELLWLIKLLQHQAEKAGGKVHLLLGNHEVMNLQGDNRYISDEYFFLSEKAGFSYTGLFDSSHELGRWLHSLNTVVVINDMLFVHAGISPELLALQLGPAELNKLMRNYLSKDQDSINQEDSIYSLILGEKGPLWYRGYLMDTNTTEGISHRAVKETLNFYQVNKIIYGHTADKNFRTGFNNSTICVDVSVNAGEKGEHALLVKEGKFFKVYADGESRPLF